MNETCCSIFRQSIPPPATTYATSQQGHLTIINNYYGNQVASDFIAPTELLSRTYGLFLSNSHASFSVLLFGAIVLSYRSGCLIHNVT